MKFLLAPLKIPLGKCASKSIKANQDDIFLQYLRKATPYIVIVLNLFILWMVILFGIITPPLALITIFAIVGWGFSTINLVLNLYKLYKKREELHNLLPNLQSQEYKNLRSKYLKQKTAAYIFLFLFEISLNLLLYFFPFITSTYMLLAIAAVVCITMAVSMASFFCAIITGGKYNDKTRKEKSFNDAIERGEQFKRDHDLGIELQSLITDRDTCNLCLEKFKPSHDKEVILEYKSENILQLPEKTCDNDKAHGVKGQNEETERKLDRDNPRNINQQTGEVKRDLQAPPSISHVNCGNKWYLKKGGGIIVRSPTKVLTLIKMQYDPKTASPDVQQEIKLEDSEAASINFSRNSVQYYQGNLFPVQNPRFLISEGDDVEMANLEIPGVANRRSRPKIHAGHLYHALDVVSPKEEDNDDTMRQRSIFTL